MSSAGGVPEGAEIVGTAPALVDTTGKVVAESESDIEVTPKKMAPSIVKTRAMAITVRNKIFMG